MSNVVQSLDELARWAAQNSAEDAYRSILGFVADVSAGTHDDVYQAIIEEPALATDRRVDSLMAAAAEHVAFHSSLSTPRWCLDTCRFLTSAWFPVDLPSVRVRALVTSPASFWRRGIFIDRSDLDRV